MSKRKHTPEELVRLHDEWELLQLINGKSVSIEWLAHRLGWGIEYVDSLLQTLKERGYLSDEAPASNVIQRRTDMDDHMDAEDGSDEFAYNIVQHTPGALIATMACTGYSRQKMGDEPLTFEKYREVFSRYLPQFVEHCDEPAVVATLCHVPFREHVRLGEEAAETNIPICKYPSFVLSIWHEDEKWSDEGDNQRESPE